MKPKTIKEYYARASARKAKRDEKSAALGFAKKKRRKPSARKAAFARLVAMRNLYIMARNKHRNGGYCEVGVLCGGAVPSELVYHVIPAATGNAVKHDPRNLLGACRRCNGGEYFDRKRGTYARWDDAHARVIGNDILAALKAMAGRAQIQTVAALEMAEVYRRALELREFSQVTASK